MPEDLEVGVKLVPDEESIEEIEDGEVQLSSDGAMEDQTEIQEQQSGQLAVIGRGISRLLSVLKQLSIIAAAVAVISKILGSALNIGFEDVRDAIVHALDVLTDTTFNALKKLPNLITKSLTKALNSLKNALLEAIPGASPSSSNNSSPSGVTSFNPDTDAVQKFMTNASGEFSNQTGGGNQTTNVNVLTSRDALLGDSTQQEMQSQSTEDVVINGGS